MADATPVKRTRKSAPRSRTGCTTCKIRHAKCDETKPECRKCIDSGRKCDGYETNVSHNQVLSSQALTKGPHGLTSSYPTFPLAITSYSIPFRIPGGQRERQMLHYFCVQGSSDMSGYLDSDFWNRIALQFSHEVPVVRQALVALSEGHLEFATKRITDTGRARVADGLKDTDQYGKAIRKLCRYLTEKPAKDVVLVCCMLLFCLEVLRDNYDGALGHLQSGLKVLKRHEPHMESISMSSGNARQSDYIELMRIFFRLDINATMFDDSRMPVLEKLPGVHPDLGHDMKFRTLGEARDALDMLHNRLLRLMVGQNQHKFTALDYLPLSILEEKNELLEMNDAWSTAIENFIAETSDGDKPVIKGPNLLKLQHRTMQMFLFANFPCNEAVFMSSPNLYAHDILDLAESLIEISSPNPDAPVPVTHRSFTSEMGVVGPLTVVAIKCNDLASRERAVGLLRSASFRREGLYDGNMMLSIIEKIQGSAAVQSVDAGPESTIPGSGPTSSPSLEDVAYLELTESVGGRHVLARTLNVPV